MPAPEWIDSPYVSLEYNNWTIDDNAPQALKDDFYAWMKAYDDSETEGIHM